MSKVFIAIPTHEMMEAEFVRCLTALKTKHQISFNYEIGTIISFAREGLAKAAIRSGADYVLWLDSDMVFEPDIIDKFIADDVDFVTGVAHRRKPPYTPCIWQKLTIGVNSNDCNTVEYLDYPKEQLFEVDACGFAGCLVKVEMLKALMEKYHALFIPLTGYGEDISFCIRARMSGYKLYCDSRVQLGHMGRLVVTSDSYEMYRRNTERIRHADKS